MTQDEEAIRALITTWMEATRRGDTETVLSLMADDVVFGHEPFGKEALASLASEQMEGVRLEATGDIVELKGARALGLYAQLLDHHGDQRQRRAAVQMLWLYAPSCASSQTGAGCWRGMPI